MSARPCSPPDAPTSLTSTSGLSYDGSNNSNNLFVHYTPRSAVVSPTAEADEEDAGDVVDAQRSPSESHKFASSPALHAIDVAPSSASIHPLREPLLRSSSTAAAATTADASGALAPPSAAPTLSAPSQWDWRLILVGVALLVNFIINNVTWIYCSDYLGQNYAFAFNQLSTFLLLLMQAPYVVVQVWRGQILWSEVRAVPLVPLLCMGLLDAMYDILSSMGSPYTPGDIQTLMFQLPTVLVMYGSYLLFKKRFRIGQYVGGIIILAGCCLSIGPGLVDVIKNHGGASSGTNVGSQVKAASVLITFISVLFYCANVLFKEYALKHTKVNVWFLSVAISALNFVLTFFLVPLLWIPTMGTDTPSNTFPHMWAGIRCVVEGVSTMDPTAQCHSLWYLTLINAVTNVLVNVLTLQLVRSGSALLLQVVSGLNLVGCNLFYASRVIMGSTLVVAMDRFMWAGLGVVVAGFVVYSFVPLEKTKKNRAVADAEATTSMATAEHDGVPVASPNTSDWTTINASSSNGSRSYSSLN